MAILQFPPIESADPETGLLAVGGDLEPESLILAYRNGIFPWPFDAKHLTWFAPLKRCILFLDSIKFSTRFLRKIRSLEKTNSTYQFTRNQRFEEVIHYCSIQGDRFKPEKTWITADIKKAYIELYQSGFAESFECVKNNKLVGNLIGGVYGVKIDNFFAGESMFHLEGDGSKMALWFLSQELLGEGIKWMDCQVMNPFLEKLGAVEVERGEYMEMLRGKIRAS